MSATSPRQGAELRPSLHPQYNALNPNGYTIKPNIYTDTRHAHLLGEEYTLRRRGKLQMIRAPHKFIELYKKTNNTDKTYSKRVTLPMEKQTATD